MKYIANPVIVEAFRIVEVRNDHDALAVVLRLENGREEAPDGAMLARMVPQVGDYWVIQSDGYAYLNPKDVFERKYSPKPDYPVTMYKLVGNEIRLAQGIVDAAHEAIATQNGWSREKPELPAPSDPAQELTFEARLAALEKQLAPQGS